MPFKADLTVCQMHIGQFKHKDWVTPLGYDMVIFLGISDSHEQRNIENKYIHSNNTGHGCHRQG
jgi:hypothetical protein